MCWPVPLSDISVGLTCKAGSRKREECEPEHRDMSVSQTGNIQPIYHEDCMHVSMAILEEMQM